MCLTLVRDCQRRWAAEAGLHTEILLVRDLLAPGTCDLAPSTYIHSEDSPVSVRPSFSSASGTGPFNPNNRYHAQIRHDGQNFADLPLHSENSRSVFNPAAGMFGGELASSRRPCGSTRKAASVEAKCSPRSLSRGSTAAVCESVPRACAAWLPSLRHRATLSISRQ